MDACQPCCGGGRGSDLPCEEILIAEEVEGAFGGDFTRRERNNSPRCLPQAKIVGGVMTVLLPSPSDQKVDDLALAAWVECGGWLVEKEDFRVEDKD